MAFSFLYYPYISIPKEDWLRRVLLYSDVIATIVPGGYENRRDISRHMQVLREAGEVEYIVPEEYLHQREVQQAFERDVLDLLTSPEFVRWRRTRWDRIGRQADVRQGNTEVTLLNRSKLTDQVEGWLRDEGLVGPGLNDNWLAVEPDIAHIYMGVLAKHIASHALRGLVPTTDRPSYERAIFGRLGRQLHGRIPVADILMKKGLVVPQAGTPIGDIIQFKRHPAHWAELLEHRQFLREYQVRLSNATSHEEVVDIVEEYTDRVEAGICRIQRMMKMARLKAAGTAVKALVTFELPAAIELISAAADFRVAMIDAPLLLLNQELAPFAYVFNAANRFGPFQSRARLH